MAVERQLFAQEEGFCRERLGRTQTQTEKTQGLDQPCEQRASELYEVLG